MVASSRTTRTLRLLAPAACALALAGCGSQPSNPATPSPSSPPPPSSAPTAPSSATPTASGGGTATATPTASGSATPAVAAECRLPGLSVGGTTAGGAMGHQGVILTFVNTGASPCLIRGYPGVAGLDSAGNQIAQATRSLRGYMGGLAAGVTTPPAVTLAHGQTASALVEASSVPVGTQTACPVYQALLVTPPDETHSVKVSQPLPGCSGLQVHPVVAGATGSQTS